MARNTTVSIVKMVHRRAAFSGLFAATPAATWAIREAGSFDDEPSVPMSTTTSSSGALARSGRGGGEACQESVQVRRFARCFAPRRGDRPDRRAWTAPT